MKKLAAVLVLMAAALSAQERGTLRFVNETAFTVHITAGSGRTDVGTISPHGERTVTSAFGQTEYFYPLFDVPLTARFLLRDVRPLDPNLYYQIDDSRIGGTAVTIGAVPPLNDPFSYIILVNNSRTGGVSVARAASSRLSRIDADGSDNVNAGERGVFRINPREPNVMRVASPADIAFPAADYRPGYRYVFTFDGTRVTLADTRPLHAIGLPLEASVVFGAEIPEGERPALAAALDGALTAHNAPLRVSADGGFDGGARYVFSIGLTAAGTGTRGGVTLYTGDAMLTLSRNGETLAEHKGTVTEFDEAGLYRALRRFIINGTRWYRELREAMDW